MAILFPLIGAADELPFYSTPDFTPHWQASVGRDFHSVANFSLTNQLGEQITQEEVDDRIYVASFFFSTCPGICPTIRSKLSQVQAKFEADDDVLILSHSIRPTTDTPEILQAYASNHGVIAHKWHLLTGDQSQIYSLAKNSYFASEDLGEEVNSRNFLHTENLLLIDRDRRIRGIYNGLSSSSVQHLVDDIQQLLASSKQ